MSMDESAYADSLGRTGIEENDDQKDQADNRSSRPRIVSTIANVPLAECLEAR